MSDIAVDTITECLNDLTEDEAMSVLYRLQTQFGWAGTMFTRADAEQTWRESYPLSPGQEANELEMPDDLWKAVQGTWEWREGIAKMLTEQGWNLINAAVDDAAGW